MRNRDAANSGRIAERLRRFSELVEVDSPLYSRVCSELADDQAVHQILSEAPVDQPAANILLAAVQFLLLRGADPTLAAHYPSIGLDLQPGGDPVELFRLFCVENTEALAHLVATRTVQTNEVRRCTALMPAFSWIAQRHEMPLSLIEIGPSAGLNLVFDRYRYDFGPAGTIGPASSRLTLGTEVRGDLMPPIDSLPAVSWRRGIDLHPIDVLDDDEVLWARALLWPEKVDRVERFTSAVAIAREDPPILLAGNALEVLCDVAGEAPADTALVVFHSFVLNQFAASARSALTSIIESIADDRPVDRIGIDMVTREPTPPSVLHTHYEPGAATETTLAYANHHGEWLEWLR